jgi:crotonobetainyl-CoA:carnitine CoA-transferase CaiB-like acyl-CoA transferase
MTFERVQSLAELATDPQVLANEYVVPLAHPVYGSVAVQSYPIRFDQTPTTPRRPAPELGADTLAVLVDELGYTPEQVADLIACGAAG